MKTLFCTIAAIMLMSCGFCDESKLPDGCRIVQSMDGSVYTITGPIFSGGMSANVFKTKCGAIKFSIHWNEVRKYMGCFVQPSDKYKWEIPE
jgi:hypothetical protein